MRLAGHLLVEALIEQGIDTCFGVPGESFLAALDGFHEHAERIRFVACRHEGGASFMAEAQGKLTGWPGVCFVTRGPGATNAGIGLHTAFQDSTPLVLLVGQVARGRRDREAFQEVDLGQLFGPGTLGMAKWVADVDDADRLPEYVSRAFHTAMQGRPGPVVLGLPEDVLASHTEARVLPRARPALAWPAPEALEELQTLLVAAQRPIVLLGGGGWDAASCEAMQRFAEAWRLPVACSFRRQDLFDNRHPAYVGDVGVGVDPRLAERIRRADLVVAVGPRLGEITTGGYTLLAAPRPEQRLVHVHAGAEELGRVYAADLLVHASMAAAGRALERLVPPGAVPWEAWTHEAHADYEASLVSEPVQPLDLAEVVRTTQRLAPEDTVFTNGAGNFAGWLHRFCRYPGRQHHGRTQLAPTSGAMGYGLPAAVAAALLAPERTVVNVAGDGDFSMTGQELATATRYGAGRLVCLVVDNGGFGTIRMHQERTFPGRISGTELRNPDYAALARANGWRAETIEGTAAFEPAFRRAIDAGEPTLLHLRVDPDQSTSRTTLTEIRAAARPHQVPDPAGPRVALLALEVRPGVTYGGVSDIDVDDSGNLYLLTRDPARVLVYRSTGELVRCWDDVGLVHPHGLTISGGSVHIVDQYAHVVRTFALDGAPLGCLGHPARPSDTGFDWGPPAFKDKYLTIQRGGPPFNNPTKAVVAPDGDLFVTDGYGNARVHHFSAGGALVGSWGAPGSGLGQFRLPHGLCLTRDDRLVVADRENDRLQCFERDGTPLASWPAVQRPAAVVELHDGTLLVAELGWPAGSHSFVHGDVVADLPSRLTVLAPSGRPLARLSTSLVAGHATRAHGLSRAQGGKVYVADLGADQAQPVLVVSTGG